MNRFALTATALVVVASFIAAVGLTASATAHADPLPIDRQQVERAVRALESLARSAERCHERTP